MYWPSLKYYHPIDVQVDKVTGNVTDMAVTLTAANFNNDVKTLGGAIAPQSSGADLRFFTDSALTAPIPFDLIKFSPNANPALAQIEVVTKLSLSSSVNTPLYVGWGDSTAAGLAKTDTYGQYNAYKSNYLLWCPMKDETDSTHVLCHTVNAHVGTKRIGNVPAQGTATPFINEYEIFTKDSSSYIMFPAMNTTSQFTVFCPFNYQGPQPVGNQRLISNKNTYTDTSGFEITMSGIVEPTTNFTIIGASGTLWYPPVFNNVYTDGWENVAVKFDTSNVTIFADTTQNGGSAIIASVTNTSTRLCIGDHPSLVPTDAWGSTRFHGFLDQIIIYIGVMPDPEISTMQLNWKNPGTFAIYGDTTAINNETFQADIIYG